MGWRDLLSNTTGDETIVLPWAGGRSLRTNSRFFEIVGRLPREFGWHKFEHRNGKQARWKEAAAPEPERLGYTYRGYLVGDYMLPDDVRVEADPAKIVAAGLQVHCLEDGLDRFTRICAGSMAVGEPLFYMGQDMPLGPETDVMNAFLDRARNLKNVKFVTPSLDAAFRMESWQRIETERARAEAERRAREEEERRAREEQRRQLAEQLGTGEGRRAMAQIDFAQAARAALAVGEAEYLDHKRAPGRGEIVVRFRMNNRRFECTCNERSLQIIDAGICLTAHYDDPDFEEGTRGDTFFTLESLPAVIRQAEREHRLVVLRHD